MKIGDCITFYHENFGLPGGKTQVEQVASNRLDVARSNIRAAKIEWMTSRVDDNTRRVRAALRNNPPLPRRGFQLSNLFGCRRDDTVNAVENTPPDAVNTPPETSANSSGPPI